MTTKLDKNGISFVGNLLVDRVKMLDFYPSPGMLANIANEVTAVGGCVPNTAIDLATVDPSIPISACGKIGDDEAGRFLLDRLRNKEIDVSGILVDGSHPTAYTDVMTVSGTGERTFFHNRGASAFFTPDEVDLSRMRSKMLHAGYILLLDGFDAPNAVYGTEMAAFLARAQANGIRTSIDVVSDSSARFAEKVLPALRYTDNAIMNEIEGCGAVGISPRDEAGKLLPDRVRTAMEKLMTYGISERVILHCPEAGFCLNCKGDFTICPSLALPTGYIKGSVGAGDAFCAGALYGIYHSLDDYAILEIASAAAAANLAASDSVSGMRDLVGLRKLLSEHPKRSLNN